MSSSTASNTTDPSNYVTNPPSTVVKIINTARDDMNNKLGIVVQYTEDRGRYLVHLTETQNVVAMKPENLIKANYIEQAQAQFQQVIKDPQIKRFITTIQSKLPNGITLQHVGIGIVVLLLACIFLIGFSRTIMLISFTMMVLMVVGQDLMAGASYRVVLRNAPMRFRSIVREQMPGGNYIADKPYAVEVLGALFIVFFIKSMLPSAAVSGAGSGAAMTNNNMPQPPQRVLTTTRKTLEEYYKLGFDDAAAQKEFGTSLPPPVEDTTTTTSTSMDGVDADDYELPDYPMPPSSNSGNSMMSKFFSISNALSIMYLGRTAMDLGRNADGSWEFDLFKANLTTLETWKLGLLGLSVYRIVSSLMV